MLKHLDKNFYEELISEFNNLISQAPQNEDTKQHSRQIAAISAHVFIMAFNKAVDDGYLTNLPDEFPDT